MPLAVVLSHCLLKECTFVTDRAFLHKSYLVDWIFQSLCLSSRFQFWGLCCICWQYWSVPPMASSWDFLTLMQWGLMSLFLLWDIRLVVALDWLLISLLPQVQYGASVLLELLVKWVGGGGDGEGWFASFCVCLKDCEEQNLMEFKVASQSSEI